MGKSSKTRRPYGSGSIRDLGDGRWLVQATYGRRADGSRKRVSKRFEGSRAEAEAELVALRVQLGAMPNLGDDMTLDDYFWEIFVPTRTPLLARKTMDGYISIYRCHIAPMLGGMKARDIRKPILQRWVATLPTAATAERAQRHLRAILRAMWDDELLDEEPMRRRLRLPPHQAEPRVVWTEDELMEALDRLRGLQLEALTLVMGGGGLRREEALGLVLPDDIASDEVLGMDGAAHTLCRIVVRRTTTPEDGDKAVTKTYRMRPVSIGEPFAPRLVRAISDGRPRIIMTRGRHPRPLAANSVPETWRRAFGPKGPLHGMRFMELRMLRHCHETIAARTGLSDAVNSNIHGHSDQIMYRHYIQLGADDADMVAEAVRSRLMG